MKSSGRRNGEARTVGYIFWCSSSWLRFPSFSFITTDPHPPLVNYVVRARRVDGLVPTAFHIALRLSFPDSLIVYNTLLLSVHMQRSKRLHVRMRMTVVYGLFVLVPILDHERWLTAPSSNKDSDERFSNSGAPSSASSSASMMSSSVEGDTPFNCSS